VRFMTYVAMLASLITVQFLSVMLFGGQPPRHCRYLVLVTSKPGIYSCSEYPRVRVKP